MDKKSETFRDRYSRPRVSSSDVIEAINKELDYQEVLAYSKVPPESEKIKVSGVEEWLRSDRILTGPGISIVSVVECEERMPDLTSSVPSSHESEGICSNCGHPGPGSTRQLVDGLCKCCHLRRLEEKPIEEKRLKASELAKVESKMAESRKYFTPADEKVKNLKEHRRLTKSKTKVGDPESLL
jgi:hypothetical protein